MSASRIRPARIRSAIAILALCALPAHAAEIEPLAVGSTVADFALRDLDGVERRLADCAGKKAIVLAFNGLGCPVSELYARRLERLHHEYSGRGVQFLGVNANQFDTVFDLRSFASGHGITFPILKDHENRIADMLGVERTTEVLVLDSARVLRYRGRVDDQYSLTERSVGIRKDRPETEYLASALEAVLRGEEVPVKTTAAAGCVIGRRRVIRDADSITFHRDVEPIIQKRCQPCHREGQIAPFPLIEFEDVAGWAGMIREVVVNRRMPPWHADPEHGVFSNDRSLSPQEVATLVGWIDNGAPRGVPADAPEPVSFPEGWQVGEPDAVFEIPEPFDVPAAGAVPYRYAVVETGLKEDRWVVASEVQAGERGVVHHILVFAVDPDDPRRWRRETGGGTRGYFSIMVPGERPVVHPDGMAKRLPAGATLIFQIHYTPNGRAVRDRSRVGFVFARKPITAEVHTRSAVNRAGLLIPPRAERHEIRATYRFRRPAKLLGLLPHMHLRGESFRYQLHLPSSVRVSAPPRFDLLAPEWLSRCRYDGATRRLTWAGAMPDDVHERLRSMYESSADRDAIDRLRREARTEILLNVPRYDFGWQNTYRLAEPRTVPRETLLECIAHYNNSRFNPALTSDMWSKTVLWGDQTWDEMMIGYFDFVSAERSF